MSLYTFRYKEKQSLKQDLIEASSLEVAERLGIGYCHEGTGRRFISVKDAVLLKEEVKVVEPQKAFK
jgi:hypothetical protein